VKKINRLAKHTLVAKTTTQISSLASPKSAFRSTYQNRKNRAKKSNLNLRVKALETNQGRDVVVVEAEARIKTSNSPSRASNHSRMSLKVVSKGVDVGAAEARIVDAAAVEVAKTPKRVANLKMVVVLPSISPENAKKTRLLRMSQNKCNRSLSDSQ